MFGQRGQHGSMVVETAVVLPVFFVLFIGFCQYSFALATYMNATYAARVGARYASLHSLSSDSPATQAQDEAYIQSLLFFPGASKPTVFVYYGDRSGSTSAVGNYQGDLVGVLVIWSQNINIPFFKNKTIYIATEAYRVIQR
jgi:Flp pilus assembly protein TadG